MHSLSFPIHPAHNPVASHSFCILTSKRKVVAPKDPKEVKLNMMNVIRIAPTVLALVFFAEPGFANHIGPEDFIATTFIDFEDAPTAPIEDFYKSTVGVTFVNMSGGRIDDTGTGEGKSTVACNFPPDTFLPGEVLFDEPVIRVGFFITANNFSTTIIQVYHFYLENTLVRTETFDTGGDGRGGSFAGIEFPSGFDRIIITTVGGNGAFCIDNLRFDGFPPPCTAGCEGDPHFKTWRGQHYDFHGECDLVLLQSKEFESGLGLDVHIRTKIRRDMSYISSAALRIGSDVLEVESQGVYWLNGALNADLPDEFSGFSFSHTQPTDKQHVFEVHLGGRERVKVKTYKDFVSVLIEQGENKHFGDSAGLMGDFRMGHMIARDGKTVIEDANAFGQEWQVLDTEPGLFQTVRLPQHPNVCTMPTPVQASQLRRRLSESSSVDELAAEKACAHWGEGKDDCVFDVLTTGDLEMAMVGAY
jgi:hypothetical protein